MFEQKFLLNVVTFHSYQQKLDLYSGMKYNYNQGLEMNTRVLLIVLNFVFCLVLPAR